MKKLVMGLRRFCKLLSQRKLVEGLEPPANFWDSSEVSPTLLEAMGPGHPGQSLPVSA